MKVKNGPAAYGLAARFFHWSIAALIAVAIGLGLWASSIGPRNPDAALAELRDALLFWHKSLGLTVLGLACARLAWAIAMPRPPFPDHMSKRERWLASLVHIMLYGLIFAMPLSGIWLSQAAGFEADWFGLLSFPTIITADGSLPPFARPEVRLGVLLHKLLFWYALIACLVLHIAGLLKHLLIDRNPEVWRRMAGRF